MALGNKWGLERGVSVKTVSSGGTVKRELDGVAGANHIEVVYQRRII